MNKRVVRCLLSRSHHPLIHFSSNLSLVDIVFTCSRYLMTTFISTPPPDEMYGLDDPSSPNESQNVVDLTKEYSFLHDSLVTYTAMIDGFGTIGKLESCLELLERMGSKGVAPNYVTYRVLIDHCCRNGVLDVVHNLLEEMKQTHWRTHTAGYHKVIEGFNKEFIESLGLLDEIGQDDTAPFLSVYRLLVDNLIKAQRLEMALKLLEEVATFSPTLVDYSSTYNSLIESLCLAK